MNKYHFHYQTKIKHHVTFENSTKDINNVGCVCKARIKLFMFISSALIPQALKASDK